MSTKPNVALVVLDTMRKDYFDKHFGWLPGTRYENAWSTSHWTAPAHTSLFTGKYPSEVGVSKHSPSFPSSENHLAERLSDAGYRTRGMTQNIFASHHFGYDAGFQEFEESWRVQQIPEQDVFDWGTFIDKTRQMGPERFAIGVWECIVSEHPTIPSLRRGLRMKLNDLGVGLPEDEGTHRFYELLQDMEFKGEGEFLFLNMMETHAPYDPPKEYQTVEPPEVNNMQPTLMDDYPHAEKTQEAYDNAVHYQSDMYKKIYEEIGDDFDYIVTVGDHGEMLGEEGMWRHWRGIYEPMTHVPLVVSDGEGSVESPVSLVDVNRAITDVCGLSPSGRGEVLGDRSEALVQYKGIEESRIEGARNMGKDISDYDTELNGLADDEGYFFETLESFRGPPNKEERIKELMEEVPWEMTREEVSSTVQEHLKDLGYA